MRIVLFIALLITQITVAQQSYTLSDWEQSHYYIEAGKPQTKALNHEDWDLSFETHGQQAGIRVNHNRWMVYLSQDSPQNWDSINEVNLQDSNSYFNSLNNWSYGALNQSRNTSNQFDFGWGEYQFSSHEVIGNKVFWLRDSQGNWLALLVERLDKQHNYHLRWKWQGGPSKETIVPAGNFSQKSRLFFSFTQETHQDLEPESWDLFLTKNPQEGNQVFIQSHPDWGKQFSETSLSIEDLRQGNFTKNQLDWGKQWRSDNGETLNPSLAYFARMSDTIGLQVLAYNPEEFSIVFQLTSQAFLGLTQEQNQEKNQAYFELFPNPSIHGSPIQIESKHAIQEIKIIGPTGAEIGHQFSSENTVNIPRPSPGLYLILLKINNQWFYHKQMLY